MPPPAYEPHGRSHFCLAYVLGAHVANGWLGAVDMLTRTATDEDFAPDASVYPEARDPVTSGRQLEALAFEVAASQPLRSAGHKARALVARGVPRVFCIAVKRGRVLEWSRETNGWELMPTDASIEAPCLARPLPVKVLIDGALADDAVVRALHGRGNAVLRGLIDEGRDEGREEGHEAGRAEGREEGREAGRAEGREEGHEAGRAEGLRIAVMELLTSRGLAPTPAQAARIARETDEQVLRRWLVQAAHAATVGAAMRRR